MGTKKKISEKIKMKILKTLKIKSLYYKDMKKIVSKKQRYNNNFIKFYLTKFLTEISRPSFKVNYLYIFKLLKY